MEKNRSVFNSCNIYIMLWCLYLMQGTLYSSGSMTSRALLMLILGMSIYFFFVANLKYNLPRVLRILSVFISLLSVYGLLNIVGGNVFIQTISPSQYLKALLISLLSVYPFYVFTCREQLTEKSLQVWTCVFFVVAITAFFRDQREMLQSAIEMGSTREEFTLNSSYRVLGLLPLVGLFRKKPLLQYVMMGLILFFVLSGMKRGAMLTVGVCIVWVLYQSFREERNRRRLWMEILGILLITAVVYYVQFLLENSDYFNIRLMRTLEGDTSERDRIYSTFIYYFVNETNLFTLFFGSGADSTLRLYGSYAHNDWLELAIDNGILGVALYIFYWYYMIRTWRFAKTDRTLFLIIGIFVICGFMRSLFSMSFNSLDFYTCSAFGYALAKLKRQNVSIV